MIDEFLPFFIAIGIGLAIGIERERRYANVRKAMGVRSFILIALLGALAGYVSNPLIAAVITLFAGALIVAAYFQTTKLGDEDTADIGLTTELAAGVTFVTGFIVHTNPSVATMLGLVTLVVLLSRKKLHDFTLNQITTQEIQAAVILLVFALGVLPLLPKEPVDPWGILNLHRSFMVVILIGSVQFVGYIATRIFGTAIGFPLTGFLSGFVSSTAVFLTMASRVKETPRITRAAASASLFAAASTFLFLLGVIGTISIPLLKEIALPIVVSSVIALGAGYLLTLRDGQKNGFPTQRNPLSLVGALKLAALLIGFIWTIGVVQHFLGDRGSQVASFLAGLGELHGVSIASASLLSNGTIQMEVAKNNVLLAALASLISKLVITWVLVRGRYALWITLVVGLMTAGFLCTWIFL